MNFLFKKQFWSELYTSIVVITFTVVLLQLLFNAFGFPTWLVYTVAVIAGAISGTIDGFFITPRIRKGV